MGAPEEDKHQGANATGVILSTRIGGIDQSVARETCCKLTYPQLLKTARAASGTLYWVQAATRASPAGKHVRQRARQSAKRRSSTSILVVCLVVFGLLNIPVECAVAAGPHSMFLAPDTIAGLQRGKSLSSTSPAHASHDRAHDDEDSPDAVLNSHAHGGMNKAADPAPGAPASQPGSAMPTPAGFASDSIPLWEIASPVAGPRLLGPAQHVTTWTAPLMAHETDGPEPPSPNLI